MSIFTKVVLFFRPNIAEVVEVENHGYLIRVSINGSRSFLDSETGYCSFNDTEYVWKHCVFQTRKDAEKMLPKAERYIDNTLKWYENEKQKKKKKKDFKKALRNV